MEAVDKDLMYTVRSSSFVGQIKEAMAVPSVVRTVVATRLDKAFANMTFAALERAYRRLPSASVSPNLTDTELGFVLKLE